MIDTNELFDNREDRRESIIGRIFARCKSHNNGCILWTGPDSGTGRGGGYGRMSLDGQTVATHLVVFTHFFGYIPSKKQVDHTCNNRLCCNPNHLQLVTPLKNARLRNQRMKQSNENTQSSVTD
jgi:hypothetical protein